MSSLLLELYSEEIPASMQENAESQIKNLLEANFKVNNVQYSNLNSTSSPCRITVICDFLEDVIKGKDIEKRGPAVNGSEDAINNFAKSCGVAKAALTVKESKGQQYYFFNNTEQDKHIKELLQEIIPEALSKISWPKSMYWGDYDISWVRPLKNILCILCEGNKSEVIKFNFGHLSSNNITFGHKFLSQQKSIPVGNYNNYKSLLKEGYIIISRNERQEIIKEGLLNNLYNISKDLTLDNIPDFERLLNEVVGLVEYPVVLKGEIPSKFLKLPKEVLVTAIRVHQKYFTVADTKGNILSLFFFVSNIKSLNQEIVIKGNEKVLNARLSDALYFYNRDLESRLEDNYENLKKVTFHAKLGSLKDKTDRIIELLKSMPCIELELEKEKVEQSISAAKLSKCDLLTEMVGEFPELEGVMGRYYALNDGYSSDIAFAIEEHYLPESQTSKVPSTEVGSLLAIADKIDSLTGLFIAGERATGSKDPFGMRRLAIGILRIILEKEECGNLNLKNLVERSILIYNNSIQKKIEIVEVLNFLEDRLKYLLKGKYDVSLINAVISIEENIVTSVKKLEVLSKFIENNQGIVELYKRVKNIVGNATIKGINLELLNDPREKMLSDKVREAQVNLENFIKNEEYERFLQELLKLKEPVSNFLDNVNIMSAEAAVKNNRLGLLNQILEQFKVFCKFELIQLD